MFGTDVGELTVGGRLFGADPGQLVTTAAMALAQGGEFLLELAAAGVGLAQTKVEVGRGTSELVEFLAGRGCLGTPPVGLLLQQCEFLFEQVLLLAGRFQVLFQLDAAGLRGIGSPACCG